METKSSAGHKRPGVMSDALYDYMLEKGGTETVEQAELRAATNKLEMARMLSSRDEGYILQWLVRALNVRKIVEVGVFTGYATLTMALGLPEDGQIVALDVSDEYTSVGKPYWERAGVADRIKLVLAPAMETLEGMVANGEEGTVDFAFLDADKVNYANYYEIFVSKLLRKGGVLAIDNVFWSGSVCDPTDEEEDTKGIRSVNDKVAQDPRVQRCMIPVADGVTLVLKL